MTIFVDASALIAIIAGEQEADALSDILEADRSRLCSAISVWETVAGLRRSYMFSIPSARTHVRRFLDVGSFRFVGIGETEFEIAMDAYADFGKGRHPAGLNLGDCYAYACAKVNDAKLLFKGDDFAKTGCLVGDSLSECFSAVDNVADRFSCQVGSRGSRKLIGGPPHPAITLTRVSMVAVR